ncbi:MAG: hypothetical protein CVU39_01895 [Chloroflexi bacterium HGW-Chloroflexi-10]|nr:MAG: hypothetical protein CVU39_01895 [Chloroflexi bacterium HGW-Chloroflexi-10]
MKSNWIWIAIVVIVIVCLCCSCLGLGVASFLLIKESETTTSNDFPDIPFNLDDPFSETPEYDSFDPTPSSELYENTVDPLQLEAASETLETLKNAIVPNNDPRELAIRLRNLPDVPELVPDYTEYQVGDQKEFWATNVDTNENSRIDAILAYKTDEVYFWIEDGVDYNEGELSRLVETFSTDIYPKNREFFGSEWNPGIDDNPRLFLLYATNLGSSLAGYFSSADSVPPQAHEFSNAHEMFMLNADNISLDEKFTYGVLAHEFQHMIHWYRDRNETSWLNEGFSELAAFLNGYYESGFDYLAMTEPDMQLNDWPNDSNATTPHYGAAFLFVAYFLDRFGEDSTKAVVSDEANGLDSIDKILQQMEATDPETGQPILADDFFADWVVANFLLDPGVEDGRFAYSIYDDAPRASQTETVSGCDSGWLDRSVSQYGADYIELDCGQNFTLSFQGTTEVGVLPASAYSGDYAFWSNKGDESDMRLTQTFDFTGVDSPIEISYQTWYDLETDYDYLYLTASTDGETWQILDTPSCTSENPSGNSFGCGYNDVTNGWIQETIDLSQFAGQEVELRFEYITDAAVNGEGFLLDDVEIPQINYFSDFEMDEGGWIAEGWVRIQNSIPQTYRITLIEENGDTTVTQLSLSSDQTIQVPVDGAENRTTYVVISGTTRFTRQDASYRIKLEP